MSILRVGSTDKYAEGWEAAFGKAKPSPKTAKKKKHVVKDDETAKLGKSTASKQKSTKKKKVSQGSKQKLSIKKSNTKSSAKNAQKKK